MARPRPSVLGPAAALLALLGLLVAATQAGAVRGFDASRESNVYDFGQTWSASAADIDRDGDPDAVIGRHKRGLRLLENRDGVFVNITRPSLGRAYERRKDRHDCIFGDVNVDRLLDMYCTVGGRNGRGRKANELWIRRPDGTYELSSKRFGVRDPYGRGRFASFIDANADRFPDLYIGNQYPRMDSRRSLNRLLINRRGRRFRSAPRFGLQRELGGDAVQAIDFDRDGFEDLLVCGQKEERLKLYRNERGRRFGSPPSLLRGRPGCRDAALGRADRDRRADLFNLTGSSLRITRQRKGRFGVATYNRRIKAGRRIALGDVNRDGLDDVYVVRGRPRGADPPDLMLRNRGAGRGFARVPIPQTRQGSGDGAEPIDHDGNGRDDFIVLNGDEEARGPTRLIAFR